MGNKKIIKFVSGAVLFGNTQALAPQAYGDFGSATKYNVFNKDVLSHPNNEQKFDGFGLLCLSGSIFIVVAVYCVLCNIERTLIAHIYDKFINDLKSEMSSAEEKSTKQIETKEEVNKTLLNIKEENEKYKNDIENIKRQKEELESRGYTLPPALKEIGEEVTKLGEYHSSLNKLLLIENYEETIKKDTEFIDEVIHDLATGGIIVHRREFFRRGCIILDYERYCSEFFLRGVLEKLEDEGVKVIYTRDERGRETGELDLDKMVFPDSDFKTRILCNVKSYKFLVSKKDLFCEGGKVRAVLERRAKALDFIEENEKKILKSEINSEQYKSKVKLLLEKVKNFLKKSSVNILEVDQGIFDLCLKLEKKLIKILTNKEDDLRKLDYGMPFMFVENMKKQLEESYKKKKDKLENKTKKIQNKTGDNLKRVELLMRKLEELNKNLQYAEGYMKHIEEQSQKYSSKKENVEKRKWYQLHCIGGYYRGM